jgi:CDP-6-deoxy-D-xylo-4-hexulose-3-dehydrase
MEIIKKEIFNLVQKYAKDKYKIKDFIRGIDPIPVSGKILDSYDLINLVDSSLDGWLTTGRFNKQFEKEIIEFLDAKIAITVNSGSSANLIALTTLTSKKLGDIAMRPGDEVITVAAGFPTTVNPIIQNGMVPVFIDIDIPTFNVDAKLIEGAITSKTKAIMIAHSLGNPFEVKKVREICDKYNLWLVQDTCDALGSKFNGKNLGFYGDIGTVSFYPAHHITMGEGGLVYFNSKKANNIKLKRIAESLRDWGRDCYCETGKDNTCKKRFQWKLGDLPFGYDHKYTYSHIGYNLKITDMQAACGLSQLGKLKNFIKTRVSNHGYLYNGLKDYKEYFILPEKTKFSDPSWFGFLLTINNNKFTRNEIIKFLNSKLIGTRLLFSGNIIKQPYFKDVNFKVVGKLTNTDKAMNDSFWLGVYPGINNKMLDYVLDQIKSFIKKN